MQELTPTQIVLELDKYVIGQQNAKKSVAIALRNRWRRQQVPDNLREEIMPNNIILIGPTGVGKTEIARRLARLSQAPFIKVEASKFTEIGYVGRDVDSIIRDLVDLAISMVRTEKLAVVQEQAEKHAIDRLLDVLLPKRSVPESVEQNELSDEYAEKYLFTREKLQQQLVAGELDDQSVEIEVSQEASPMLQIVAPMNLDDVGLNLQDLLGPNMPQEKKMRQMSVKEARDFLIQEESQKLIDMDAVIALAIKRVENSGIVFLDEIDKIAGENQAQNPDISRAGVQRDLLPVVEGSTVATKYGMVHTGHILFIASGAFHVSKPSDLIPELQGRFPIRVELDSLTTQDFIKILTEPENSLVKQYTALLATEGVDLSFSEDAITEIAEIASNVNTRAENIGARRLHTIMSTLLEDILFDVPDKKINTVRTTREMVRDRLQNIVKDDDLSRYIL